MPREQHTVITEGATLTMGEELFEPEPMTRDIVGCCGDLYLASLNTFIFAFVFSSEVGVYQGRQDKAKNLTKGFEARIKSFGDVSEVVITVPSTLIDRREKVEEHIQKVNSTFHELSDVWEQHMVREVWMLSMKEAKAKGIEQRDVILDAPLDSNPELESLLSNSYVDAMHATVRANIGHRTPKSEILLPFIRRDTVAHIGAHLAYDSALTWHDDLGSNRSLIPHPTRQTLVTDSKKELIAFVVPSVLFEIVVMQDAINLDELRQKLGNYAERSDIIEIQRFVAETLALPKEERQSRLANLNDAATSERMNIAADDGSYATRALAIKRARYLDGKSEYDSRLRKIFPTLSKPAPAKDDQPEDIDTKSE